MNKIQRERLSGSLWMFIRSFGVGVLLLSLAGCAQLTSVVSKIDGTTDTESVVSEESVAEESASAETVAEKPKPSKLYEWKGDGRKVSRIIIDTDKQRASFYSGEEEIGWSTIASGLPKHPTPVGEFAVIEKTANKRSNLYGKVVKGGRVIHSNAKAGRDPVPAGASFEGAHMPYFMRLTYDGIGLHAGPIPRPGQPASHGCIRLPSTLAPVLFKHVSHGTPVKIVGNGPNYGNYMEKQRIAAAQRAAREAEQKRLAEQNAAEAAASGAAEAVVASVPVAEASRRLSPAERSADPAPTRVATEPSPRASSPQQEAPTRIAPSSPPDSEQSAPERSASAPGPSTPAQAGPAPAVESTLDPAASSITDEGTTPSAPSSAAREAPAPEPERNTDATPTSGESSQAATPPAAPEAPRSSVEVVSPPEAPPAAAPTATADTREEPKASASESPANPVTSPVVSPTLTPPPPATSGEAPPAPLAPRVEAQSAEAAGSEG
jgi:hypothetical protein